ncbi:hypothetical protein EEAAV_26620 (plasmid) [Rahnella aceris]
MTKLHTTTVDISPTDIVIEPGFNPREAIIGDECYRIEPVKSLIVAVRQAYKEYRHVEPIKVVKRGIKYYVRQGHCRTKALFQAIDEGTVINTITVILLPDDNLAQGYLENFTGNRSNSLGPVARAQGLKVAIEEHGFSVKELAEHFCCTQTAIRNSLKITEMPTPLQLLIIKGLITQTFALQLMIENRNDHNLVMNSLVKAGLTTEILLSEPAKAPEILHKTVSLSPVPPNVDTENTTVDPTTQQTSDKQKRLTRSSLGMKRLPHKKSELLQKQFMAMTSTLYESSISEPDEKIIIQVPPSHAGLFKNHSSINTGTVEVSISASSLQTLAELINKGSIGIFISSDMKDEILNLRDVIYNLSS